jgi:hypothetical protein
MNEQEASEFSEKVMDALLKDYVIIKKERWEELVKNLKEINEITNPNRKLIEKEK